jgi:hypothetical protein
MRILVPDGERLNVVEPSVIAFEHHRIHRRGLATDIGVARDGMTDQGRAAGSDRERIGKKERRLDDAQLLHLHQSGALAESVEHVNGRYGFLPVEIAVMRQDGGDAGADVAVVESCMSDPNARHVRDAVAGAWRQTTAGQSGIIRAKPIAHGNAFLRCGPF